jgi:uncharacterized protein (TIGR03435 family)
LIFKHTFIPIAALAGIILPVALRISLVRGQSAPVQQSSQTNAAPPEQLSDRTAPSFEVASIKPTNEPGMGIIGGSPGTYTATRITVEFLIMTAYNVEPFRISGEPKWAQSQRFDVQAKADDAMAAKMKAMTPEERFAQTRLMLQSLLADRFKLLAHRTTTDSSVLSLIVSKPGKLPVSDCTPPSSPEPPVLRPGKWPEAPCGRFIRNWGHIEGKHRSVTLLVDSLSFFTGKTVVDNTGLTGLYDISLDWTPAPGEAPPAPPGGAFPQPDPNGPSLQAALEDQLGLKLESAKGPVDTIVIDRLEQPTPN